MRTTFTTVAALVLAFGAPAAGVAQDSEAAELQQLSSAGFGNARMLDGVEVARVTDEEGRTFFVLGGLDPALGGAGDLPATGGEAGPVTDMVTSGSGAGTDPLAGQNLTEQVQTGGAGSMSLEEQLAAAGFTDYEILEEAKVAEVVVGEGGGQALHVIMGVNDGGTGQ